MFLKQNSLSINSTHNPIYLTRQPVTANCPRFSCPGRKVRREEGGRVVVRRHPLRPPGGRAALRRRQPASAAGEGQTRRLPHTPLRATGLPESAQGHDRGQSGQEAYGEYLEHRSKKRCRNCSVGYCQYHGDGQLKRTKS